MDRPQLPLNALRAFEASARHLSFTRAGLELCVSQAAVSHHVKRLEERLGTVLFRRLPRGLALTDEGAALVPALGDAFDRIGTLLDRFTDGRFQEVLTLGVVGTFATGWLLPRLADFRLKNPFVDLRLMTNNNRVDLAGDGLDYAIRFGDGAWHGCDADRILAAPFTPMCAPTIAARLTTPQDLASEILLRSYRADEWASWFRHTDAPCTLMRGPMFDSSIAMAAAAVSGHGVALLPIAMFESDASEGRLVRPFAEEVELGSYWLTRLKTRQETSAMRQFRDWLLAHGTAH